MLKFPKKKKKKTHAIYKNNMKEGNTKIKNKKKEDKVINYNRNKKQKQKRDRGREELKFFKNYCIFGM